MRDVLSDMLRDPEDRWADAFGEQPLEERELEEEIGIEASFHSHPLDFPRRSCRCGECPPDDPPSCMCLSEGPLGLRCRRMQVRHWDRAADLYYYEGHGGRCCAFTAGGEFVEW